MRLIPLAAAAATVLLTPFASHAAGAGAVELSGSSFFRPGKGVVLAGACTYDGVLLTATATAAPVGGTGSVSITCTLYTPSGTQLSSITASGSTHAVEAVAVPVAANPSRICGSASAYVSGWIHPATDNACASVLPGRS